MQALMLKDDRIAMHVASQYGFPLTRWQNVRSNLRIPMSFLAMLDNYAGVALVNYVVAFLGAW